MTPIPFALLAALLIPDPRFEDLARIRKEARRKKAEASALVAAAHQALDRGDYGLAIGQHRSARRLEDEAREIGLREERLLPDLIAALVRDLMDDDVAVREKAVGRLVQVGPASIPALEAVLRREDPEVRARALAALERLRACALDEEGRLRQWAARARASSEYQADSWGAVQAAGRPNTTGGGDAPTAWASRTADSDEEWLELEYAHAVRPALVRIHETFNPGAVTRVEAKDGGGRWHVLWEGRDPVRGPSGWFEVRPTGTPPGTRTLRITIDNDAVAGWNEIDAVELVGESAE
jgi:hypothetical protein